MLVRKLYRCAGVEIDEITVRAFCVVDETTGPLTHNDPPSSSI